MWDVFGKDVIFKSYIPSTHLNTIIIVYSNLQQINQIIMVIIYVFKKNACHYPKYLITINNIQKYETRISTVILNTHKLHIILN